VLIHHQRNWPLGASFDPGNPASCPIITPPGGREQRYTATASVPSGAAAGSGNLNFYNYNSNLVTQDAAVLVAPGSGVDLYVFSGRYLAGTVPPPSGSVANDIALNQIVLSGGGIATATSTLTYQPTAAAAVTGTSFLDPGQSTTLYGEYYQSDLLPPITYQWFKDESLINDATGTTVDVSSGDPNTSSRYEFRVTDSEGRTVSADFTVNTTAGCGTQLEC